MGSNVNNHCKVHDLTRGFRYYYTGAKFVRMVPVALAVRTYRTNSPPVGGDPDEESIDMNARDSRVGSIDRRCAPPVAAAPVAAAPVAAAPPVAERLDETNERVRLLVGGYSYQTHIQRVHDTAHFLNRITFGDDGEQLVVAPDEQQTRIIIAPPDQHMRTSPGPDRERRRRSYVASDTSSIVHKTTSLHIIIASAAFVAVLASSF